MNLSSILIVDDCESDRYLIQRMLRRARLGVHIFEATNGEAALRFFTSRETHEDEDPERFPPTLVLLDINMPRLGGFDFLEAFQGLRQEHGYEAVVFVMLTSSAREEERQRALSYPCVKGFITKLPKSSEALLSLLRSAFQE